jgi:hypothetical protein
MIDFRDEGAFNRYIAAGSAYTTPSVLMHLARDANSAIRRRVAENPNIPADLVAVLLQDTDVDVRIGLTENPVVSVDYVELFMNDDSPDVRFSVAASPHTPGEVLLRLATDENPYVALRARKTYTQVNPHAAHEIAQLTTPPPAVQREVG